jgi:hypothetical protein
MPKTDPRQDPRVPEVIKHLKILARRRPGARLVVQDYLEYRLQHAEHLPALTTVYRLFETWPKALAAAGVDQGDPAELSRTSDDELVAALKQAAEGLGTTVLSSHAYDDYRRQHNQGLPREEWLPSSSVIRKWLGRWGQAVQRAGLETTERTTPHKPTLAEIIDALREAKRSTEGMLTEKCYTDWHAGLPADQRDRKPEAVHILAQFHDWQQALKAADVEQSDQLHPNGLWTAEEARRIASHMERILNGRPLDRDIYETLKARSTKQLPEWAVLQQLLAA